MMTVRTSMQQITDVQIYLWNMAKITIAQLHGYALAGGCELAMMADLVVAAEDTKIGHPGPRGLGTARNGCIWPLVMSMRKAKEYYYTGDSMTGAEAAETEMINYAWPKEELDANTVTFAERIANGSADHLAVLKLTMNRFYENMGIYFVRAQRDGTGCPRADDGVDLHVRRNGAGRRAEARVHDARRAVPGQRGISRQEGLT